MKLKFIYLISFFLTAFLVIVNQSSVYTRSSGTIVSKTGAPGEPTCSQCHGGSSGGSGSVMVSIAGNPTEYIPGTVYSITVDVVDPVANEYGFQLTCLTGTSSTSDGPNTGGFSAISGTWLQTNNDRQYITHNTPSTTGSWTFNWTAPNTAEGDLTFYIAGNAVNGNNSSSGDKVYTNNFTLQAPPIACSISNLVATAQDCDENGNFDVLIDFEVTEPGASNTFTIAGNGNNYGTFNYNDIPITLSDLTGDNTTNYEFVVTDTNDGNCTDNTILGTIDCPDCVISNLTATAQDCEMDGTFDVVIDFSITNGGTNNTFTVSGNGNDYGTFNYNDLPITLSNLVGDNSTNYGFIVQDSNLSNCLQDVNLGVIDCPICSIENLTATAQDCNTEGVFDVVIDFDVENAGGSFFTVHGNGNSYGLFNYNELPITITDLVGDNSTSYEFVVTDNTIFTCSAAIDLGQIDCPVCSISNLVATAQDCKNDGTFDVLIDFDFDNNVSNFFSVTGNFAFYGSFAYSSLPITIPGIIGDNNTAYEFVVTDNNLNSCNNVAEVGVVNCPVCSINDLTVDLGDCNDDGTYSLTINFIAVNPTNSSFDVFSGETFIGFFAYADLPITLPSFQNGEGNMQSITVSDNDNNVCSSTVEFEGLDCPIIECAISNVIAEAHECDSDGNFLVDIDFDIEDAGSMGFTIVGNGTNYGTFEYGQTFYTIGPLVGDGETIYEFIVTDVENGDCSAFTGFEEPIDCPVICSIFDIVVDLGSCNDDGTYSLTLNFEHENTTNDFFDVHFGEIFIGFFAYADLPVLIESFPTNGGPNDHITISDNDNPECSATHEFAALDCPVAECEIGELNVTVLDCNDNGNFAVSINFEFANVGDEGFRVQGNGNNYGNFEYANLPIVIDGLNGDGETNYEFVVIDNEIEGCASDIGIGMVDCGGDCSIFDIVVDLGSCNEDGTYSLTLNFEHENTTNDFFDVHFGEIFIGFFAYADLPILIESFPTNGGPNDHITISDNDNPECSSTHEFAALDCPVAECEIGELNVTVLDCNDNGNFAVSINFEFANVGDEGFRVQGNGNNYGNFEYANLPIVIDGLNGDGETNYEFVVIDNQIEGCASDIGIGTVDCGGDCSIFDIVVDLGSCNDDGTYSLTFNFEHENTTNDFFDVHFGEIFIGFFAYADLPVLIESFPTNGGPNDYITISDNDNPECSSTHEFAALDCPVAECEIGELNVTVLDCNENGNFAVSINFEFANVGDEGFRVQGNGNNYGNFSYADLPIVIDGLVGDNDTNYEFVVIDNQIEGCSLGIGIGEVDCGVTGDCNISNVFAEAGECNGDGNFFVDIEFDVEFGSEQGFTIVGNGTNYGNFQYGQNFYTIGPLVGDGTTIYEFVVRDIQDESCFGIFVFEEPIDCGGGGECGFTEISVQVGECNDNGTYPLTLNFEPNNVTNSFFDLHFGEISLGFFAYANLPITIEAFPTDGGDFDSVTISDNDNPDCSVTFEFEAPNCEVADCEIGELNVTVLDCNDDGNFAVSINFEFANVGDEGFRVQGNGNNYGNFSYADLPIVIDGLNGNGETNYEFVVIDNAIEGCSTAIDIGIVNCETANCEIANVIAEAHECNENGEFLVDIAFEVENPTAQTFTIVGNGNNYGTFEYGETFYTIGPLVGDGTTIYEFIVTDTENNDCSAFTGLDPINCDSPSCNIFDIELTISDCAEDGTFNLSVNFEFKNASEAGFELLINGDSFGEFGYNDLPLTIASLDANAVELYNIEVLDLVFETCQAMEMLVSPDCPVLLCTADAGTMPTEMVMVCDEDAVLIAAEGSVLENEDVLVYILHTSPTETLGDIIEIFFAPQVDNVNLSANTNTTYYFSAVAGPEGDTDDNFPDLGSDCTKIAVGTPVVFLQPITFTVEEDCDLETGILTVAASISGGMPSFDELATYTVNARELTEQQVGLNEAFTFSGSFNGETYFINATDENDCAVTFTSEVVDCLLDAISSPIPITFSLETLSPNPVSNWLNLQITATTPQDITLRIYDVAGRTLVNELQSVKVGKNGFDLDASAYPTGVYLLYLQNSEGIVVERFVVD